MLVGVGCILRRFALINRITTKVSGGRDCGLNVPASCDPQNHVCAIVHDDRPQAIGMAGARRAFRLPNCVSRTKVQH
jgi:hypothetical protein